MNTIVTTYENDIKNIKKCSKKMELTKEKIINSMKESNFSLILINKVILFLNNIVKMINFQEIEDVIFSVYDKTSIDLKWENCKFRLIINIQEYNEKYKCHYYGRNCIPKDRDVNCMCELDDLFSQIYTWIKEFELFCN